MVPAVFAKRRHDTGEGLALQPGGLSGVTGGIDYGFEFADLGRGQVSNVEDEVVIVLPNAGNIFARPQIDEVALNQQIALSQHQGRFDDRRVQFGWVEEARRNLALGQRDGVRDHCIK